MGKESSSLLEGNELKFSILESLQSLENVTKSGINISRMADGSFFPTTDSFSTIRTLAATEGIQNVIQGIIKDACIRGESIGPGSTNIIVDVLTSFIRAGQKELQAGVSLREVLATISLTADKIIEFLPRNSSYASFETIKTVIADVVNDKSIAALIVAALDLAGSECKIFVESTPAAVTTVERVNGYGFTLRTDSTLFRQNKWDYREVKCLIVDGIIDTVAEIDQIFVRAHETKIPIAIFARGFDTDVIQTIRVNRNRNTLNVLPVWVDFNLETANVLNDIAIIAGADVYSSLKGDLISAINFDELKVLDQIICSRGVISIINPKTSRQVGRHVDILRQKRETEPTEEVTNILDTRIRSLSSASVIIKVASPTGISNAYKLQKIDLGLRVAQSSLIHGILTSFDFEKTIQDFEHEPWVVSKIKNQKQQWTLPTLSVAAGVRFGASLAASLLSTEIALLSPDIDPEFS